ncbi:WcbI family polysaccharide biosynthesis putative acetyltransferase [Pseudodesulfovibrio sp.]|uniref:WcbI family polysaccharide biosynthesis putative acetyltransferase n=1 Tax=Pseudodesulfovibrio sp. TaxID=2035812 RepID=UPI0026085861|nr:WcbI family polysaccharide biosynthesis putative acetyltransferase [Pseudodesulfovibrio sp.]MDD3311715.1 WcbI family polysaccharide biosynthesis putative acetyltransferase [Pseudodesulfovibrio sp.]
MTRERCILHANCQGEPLLERLNRCPEFAARFETRLYTNYVREPIPDGELAACSLFLYQHLEPRWGDLASETLLGKLPKSAASLCIPNMFFKGYWPLWDGRKGFDYRCLLLDEIVDLGLPPEETVLLFLRQDVAAKFDLLGLAARSIETERQREARTPVKYVDLLLSRYREERLFNTVNHPGRLLMDHAAAGVLRELGFEPPDPAAPDAPGDPFPEFEQPLDPRVAAFFGWDFAGPDAQYNVYGRKMSFARYAANYVVARKAGITDFIGFLQGDYVSI